jgi:hypothetical protein
MQCPNCGGGLICPKCSTNASEITRLNQLVQQLNAELQRIKARYKKAAVAVTITIPIAVTVSLTASFPGLGKAVIDYLTQTAVTKSNQSDPSSGERNSLDHEDQIQPNDFIIAKDFIIEEPIKEVHISVDVACQNCTGQAPIIRKLNEDEFQKFENRIVIYNPSDRAIVVRSRAEVQ